MPFATGYQELYEMLDRNWWVFEIKKTYRLLKVRLTFFFKKFKLKKRSDLRSSVWDSMRHPWQTTKLKLGGFKSMKSLCKRGAL